MSGHTAKGTAADTTHLDGCVAFDTISQSIHTRKLGPGGLLEVAENWLSRQNQKPDGFGLLQLMASNSRSTQGLTLRLI